MIFTKAEIEAQRAITDACVDLIEEVVNGKPRTARAQAFLDFCEERMIVRMLGRDGV